MTARQSGDPAAPDPGELAPAERRQIVRDGLAVAVATGAYGISFGAIGVSSGLDVIQTCALSLLVFTGASQFAFVGVIAAGGAPLVGAASGLLLGVRNTLYGLRLAPLLAWHGARKAAAAHLVIDESTAMSVTRGSTEAARVGFLTTGLGVFVLWNASTLVGAIAGDAIGDPRDYGLDAAVGGAFLALLWPRLTTATTRIAAVLSAGVALVLVPLTPAGIPVLAAGVVALGLGLRGREVAS
ncbi:branched-chain amino acid ABC transporter permease [Nocardioides marmoriginsengisoli]|uniref:Branched-chain amino acid ABC transporter permease n=1 Tax=Nocardioides marmoriginsengisoli TaxID=661483 RepID=A0A3N0CNQ1_9ACTN|nr:AzlC family ABC transporter permease [Nocardioides marmoriginsengisoli]RNL65065.1 branched-chain amino acid ABC transporter permease [Nocardioides marmoriginsengisoli]